MTSASISFPVRRAFVGLYLALMAGRTLYEATWGGNSWCVVYAGVMGFYAACTLLSLCIPISLTAWRAHAGKLTALMLFILIVTCEVSNVSCARASTTPDLSAGRLLSYAAISAFAGWVGSRLVGIIVARDRRLHLMASGLSEALWTVDCRTGLAELGESFGAAFGYAPGAIASSLDGWAGITHADDKDRIVASFNAAASSTATHWEDTYRMRRADGAYAVVTDRCRFDRDEAGAAIFAHGGILDISARVEAEERLRELNERLEERVAERTAELGRFTFAVTHDLKTPLTSIVGYADLAAGRASVIADPVAHAHLENILRNTDRMQAFIAGVLAHSRGTAEGAPGATTLTPVFDDLTREFTPQIAALGGVLSHAICPKLRVSCSRASAHRIFQNLISNAVKYRREGVPPTVDITGRHEGDTVVVTIHDNGLGIPADDLPHIFDMHYRVAEHAHAEGHGVGLAGVRDALKRHGGDIAVASTRGEGSTFTVTLPASAQDGVA